MKKIQFLDILKDMLAGGDCPQELKGKYHPEVLARHVEMGMDYMIANVLYPKASKNENWGALDIYIKTYKDVAILYDEDRDEYYCIMPVQPVSLPSNRGVRVVSPMKDQANRFIYRDNNSNNYYDKLEVNQVIDDVRYYVEKDRLYFSKHLSPFMKKLLLKLILPFGKLDDSDEINFPEGFGQTIFDIIFDRMQKKRPEKLSNDNNSNTI